MSLRCPEAATPSRVPLRSLLLLSAPAAGEGFMLMLISIYLMKFATDQLGMAPAAMGGILLVSRLVDAVTDPIAGYWSDRTDTRLGRRRPWMLAAAVPLGACFALIWTPPVGGPTGLWMALAVVGFFLFQTAYGLPYDALTAEVSTDYRERNRVFGVRRAVWGLGAVAVFGVLAWVGESEEPSRLLSRLTLVAAGPITLAMLATAWLVRERAEHRGRGGRSSLAAMRQVLGNRDARILLVVLLLQQIGVGCVMVLAAYYAEHAHGDPGLLAPMMALVFLGSVASIPLWLRLGSRHDKKVLLLGAMSAVGLCLSSLGAVDPGRSALLYGVCGLAGVAVGALDVLLPSLQADVIDSDELATGERKEGVFFAAWHLAAKGALGIAALLSGLALSAIGLQPGVPPGPEQVAALRASISLLPFLAYGGGLLLFTRFGLTREVHQGIRRRLEQRAELRAGEQRAELRAQASGTGAPTTGDAERWPGAGAERA